MLSVVKIGGYRTMDVSLIHAEIEKIFEKTKLGRGVTMQVVELQLQIHEAGNLANVVVNVTINSGIVLKINLLEPIKLQNLRGGIPVEGVGAESKFCQRFWSGRYSGNMSQLILVQVNYMDGKLEWGLSNTPSLSVGWDHLLREPHTIPCISSIYIR